MKHCSQSEPMRLEAHRGDKGQGEMADLCLPCVHLLLVVLIRGCSAQHRAGGKRWAAQPVVWVQEAVASLMLGCGTLLQADVMD